MNRDTLTGTQLDIVEQCDFIAELLLEKNRQYGDSALNPVRIFSSADPVEQINVRIDDKLSRIASNQADDAEDAELDLIGYLVLKRVAMRPVKPPEKVASDHPVHVDTPKFREHWQPANTTPIPDLATLCNRRGGVGGVNT
jgi:hypothetical protein